MNFNINSLEEKFNNIDTYSMEINKSVNNFTNKKQIESVVCFLFLLLKYEYQIEKNKYLDLINSLSYNYLIGSDWYIGEDYTFEYFFYNIDSNLKFKIYLFLFFMNLFYHKLD